MKKVLFLLVCLFCMMTFISAKNISPDDLAFDSDFDKIYTTDDYISTYYGSGAALMYVAYLDVNDNLLESYAISYFAFQDFYNRGTKIGNSCLASYEISNRNPIEECDLSRLLIYSSEKDFSDIYYWELISNIWSSPPDYNIVPLSDFCEMYYEQTKGSYICNNYDVYQEVIGQDNRYYGILIFKEYVPVSFELVCEPKEVKKGEISNCELKVSASVEINELTIPMNSDLFDITKYNEVEGWELVDNEDGTITIKSEDGFKGEGVVLGATLKFKEDLTDNVEIALNDIHYVTADGIELNGNAKDNITIYEEPVIEDSKEEVDNPNTFDNVSLVSVLSLVTIFIALMIYRLKNIIR